MRKGAFKLEDIFISKVNIKKVRHLHDIPIEISDTERKHLIFTGKNGSGKTSVLNAIKLFLKSLEDNKYYDAVIDTDYQISLFKNDINIVKNNLNLDDNERHGQISKYEETIKRLEQSKAKYCGELELYFNSNKGLVDKYNAGEFILDYFDADRIAKVQIPKVVEKVKFDQKYTMDSKPNDMFVKYLVDLKTQQAFARNENDMNVVEKIDKWFDKFEKSLEFIMDDNNLELKFDYKNYNFEILERGKEPYSFAELSDGYSAVLNIIMDLIMRMESKKREIYDMQGIVIIDEIETHLHIGLQKKILPFLTSFFPNIQFIISTHSPFVLNSLDNAVIYDLEKHIQVEDLSAYSFEGIVEGYFDIDQYSNEIKDKLSRYKKLVYTDNKSQDEKDEMIDLRSYLKNISEKLAPELVYEFRKIEITRRGDKID